MNKAVIILIPLVIIGVLIVGGFGIYNGLVSAQEEVKTSWAQVENQYQRRADLIPNLVETVKGFASRKKAFWRRSPGCGASGEKPGNPGISINPCRRPKGWKAPWGD